MSAGDRAAGLGGGRGAGPVTAEAVQIARDLANTPATHLTATRMAEIAIVLGPPAGLGVEVFDKDALVELGLRRPARREHGQRRAGRG